MGASDDADRRQSQLDAGEDGVLQCRGGGIGVPTARTPRRPALLTVIVERDGTFATLDGDAEDGMIAAAN